MCVVILDTHLGPGSGLELAQPKKQLIEFFCQKLQS